MPRIKTHPGRHYPRDHVDCRVLAGGGCGVEGHAVELRVLRGSHGVAAAFGESGDGYGSGYGGYGYNGYDDGHGNGSGYGYSSYDDGHGYGDGRSDGGFDAETA
jgi:hypothetical protein